MTLSDISIKNPVFAWMLMFGLIFFGTISYNRMGVSQMPDVDLPMVTISVEYEGASPEIVETDIVDIIEDAVVSVEGVTEVSSVARMGSARITVELDINRNVDVALQEIQSKLSRAQRLLPDGVDFPVISKRNPEDQPIIIFAVTSDSSLKDQMTYVRYNLRDRFQTIPGVGEVRLFGYIDRNIRIWVDREKLRKYEFTVEDIINAVGREHIEVPGGNLETGKQELLLRALGEAYTVESIKNIPITQRGGSPVYSRILLKDLCEIEDGLADTKRFSRFNGRQSIGIALFKQRGANAVQVAKEGIKRADDIREILPSGYDIQVSHNWTEYIEESIDELLFTIVLSALLTGLVCFVFLGTWASTVNILMAIPMSLMGTFIFLYFFGFTLNTFTLLALTLAIGIVVDDTIMVMENISRFMSHGKDRVAASRLGARQITFAAVAATMAVVAIFLPVAFMSGIIGKYFLQFGITITVAVFLSLLEALTLTPMRSSRFLTLTDNSRSLNRIVNRCFSSLSSFYSMLLGYALKNRVKVLIISTIVFLLSLFVLIPLKKEFVPEQDQGTFALNIRLPAGTSMEYNDLMTKKVEEYLASREELSHYYTIVGGFGSGTSNQSTIILSMHKPEERAVNSEKGRPLTQKELIEIIRKDSRDFPEEMKVSIRTFSLRGFASSRGFPVEFNIKGKDWEVLGDASIRIQELMESGGMLVDVDSNYDMGQPEVKIIPDRAAAEMRGVSMASIGNTVSALIGGTRVGKFTEGGHRFDMRVRLKEGERKKIDDIKSLYVRNNRGELVGLSEVVKIESGQSMLSISRVNRERAISIYANPASGFSQQEGVDEALRIAREVLPEGYYPEITGSAKTTSESFNSLIFVLVVGIVASYMILASQFNSFIHPFIILLSLPFSFSGALFALYIMNQSINIFSFIGLILLMGLVKKNSILLVEFTNQMREKEKMPVHEALMTACPVRLRPILMTTISTIAASIPPALALGPGAETRIPMAVAVLGGMIFSTVLTLFVVPCAYSLMAKWENKVYIDLDENL